MSILITGGTGFLGSHLTRHIVREKGRDDVVLYDNLPALERIADVADRVEVVRGDVLEIQNLLETMQRHKVDRVVHLAYLAGGEVHPGRAVPYVRVQCVGTINVFEAARIHGIKRVVNASSVAAYGVSRGGSVDEDAPLFPDRPYAACKAWSEHMAAMFNGWDMEIVSLRVASSMGLGRLGRATLAQGLTTERVNFMAAPELAALGRPVTMPPDDQVTDYVHAADTAEAFWCALQAEELPHQVYNLRAEQRPVGDMTACLRRLLPDAPIEVSSQRSGELQLMNNSRLVNELGFAPRYPLEAGIEQYINEVLEREARARLSGPA
jgi:nucleoside-diphosphate-sugar epimerase